MNSYFILEDAEKLRVVRGSVQGGSLEATGLRYLRHCIARNVADSGLSLGELEVKKRA